MLPLGGAVETPKNHEVILVFPRVPDRDIPEHMTISSQKANHQGPYLPPLMAHTTCPPLPRPGFAVREEVAAPDLLSTVDALWRHQVGAEVPSRH